MHGVTQQLTAVELEHGLPEVLASPREEGRLEAIVTRSAPNERELLNTARLTPEGGIDGDRWVKDSFYRSKDGRSDPRCQVSLMNARYLRQIAGADDAMCLAGDNLIIDLDLSDANLQPGSRLAIGDEVVLEISDLAHTGCSKFQSRYGSEARAFTNNERGKSLHLRGRYASVVAGGTIYAGDMVRKVSGV